MTCGIYLITNNLTGKQYVGQSIHIEKRIKEHQYQKDLKTSYLENSIAKYGWENFTWQILHKCSEEDLNLEEIKFINLYGTYHNGYNLTKGGEFSNYGNPMHNPILKQKNINSRIGMKHKKETKIKISQTKNKTGFFKVFKEYDNKLKQGFSYRYDCKINGKKKQIRSINIRKLEKKIRKMGLDWLIVNEKLAEKTLKESDSLTRIAKKEHPTGYYRVSKCRNDGYSKGYYYRYSHHENGKATHVNATIIDELERKVRVKGWEWIKLNDKNITTLDEWIGLKS